MIDEENRRLLGEFVRVRRERLTPEGPSGRRRTPGLRREELAARAGISSVWCAWIEQGRPVQASIRTLARLAGALELSHEERARLFELADRPDPASAPPARARAGGSDHASAAALAAAPSAALVAMVERSEQPAYVVDRHANAICWNKAAAELFPGWLGDGRQRNLLRYLFTDRTLRSSVPAWQDWARRTLDDPWFGLRDGKPDRRRAASLKKLSLDSALFDSLWSASPERPADPGGAGVIQTSAGAIFVEMATDVLLGAAAYRVVLLKRLELNLADTSAQSSRRMRSRPSRRTRRAG